MGSWGTGLFSNDTAADLREDLRDLVAEGSTPEEATAQLVADYDIDDSDGEDADDFWLALAVTQHRIGHIDPEARARALRIVDDPLELARWAATDRRKRSAVLRRAKDLLHEQPPPPRRLRKSRRVDTALEPGQHVQFPLSPDGPAVLFRVVDMHEDRGGRSPIVVALDWDGSEQELRQAHRLRPMARRNVEGDVATPLGFLVTGPSDPATLVVLSVRSDANTTAVDFPVMGGPFVVPWMGIGRFFDSRGQPLTTIW